MVPSNSQNTRIEDGKKCFAFAKIVAHTSIAKDEDEVSDDDGDNNGHGYVAHQLKAQARKIYYKILKKSQQLQITTIDATLMEPLNVHTNRPANQPTDRPADRPTIGPIIRLTYNLHTFASIYRPLSMSISCIQV